MRERALLTGAGKWNVQVRCLQASTTGWDGRGECTTALTEPPVRVQRTTGSSAEELEGGKGKETWVHQLSSGCRNQNLGNSSFNERQASPSPEDKAGLLRQSRSHSQIQQQCKLLVPLMDFVLSAAERQLVTQQDSSRRFRAAGRMDPRLSPGTNHQKPDWCLVGSCHRASDPSSLCCPRAGQLCLQGSASVTGQGTALQTLPGRWGALLLAGRTSLSPPKTRTCRI